MGHKNPNHPIRHRPLLRLLCNLHVPLLPLPHGGTKKKRQPRIPPSHAPLIRVFRYFASNYFPHLPNNGTCAGEEFAAIFGCALLTSYLFLFIGFYAATYSRKGRVRANRALSTGEIAIDPKFTDKDLFANGQGTPPTTAEGKATGAATVAVNGKPNTRSRRI